MYAFIPNRYVVYSNDGEFQQEFINFSDALAFKEDMEFLFGEGTFDIMSIIH